MQWVVALFFVGCSFCAAAQSGYVIEGYEEKDSIKTASPAEREPSTDKTVSPVVTKPSATSAQPLNPPGLKMRNVGRGLTIGGGVLLISGLIVFSSADETYYSSYSTPNGTYEEGDPKAAIGILMITGGVGMTVPGIILWSKGAKKYRRYQERQEIASVKFKPQGISLQYRF
jgi:hypothetical protein